MIFDISVIYSKGIHSQICYNTPMVCIAAIFVKYCYASGSCVFQIMSEYMCQIIPGYIAMTRTFHPLRIQTWRTSMQLAFYVFSSVGSDFNVKYLVNADCKCLNFILLHPYQFSCCLVTASSLTLIIQWNAMAVTFNQINCDYLSRGKKRCVRKQW